MISYYYLVLLCLGLSVVVNAQHGQISGVIRSDQQPVEWASVGLKGTAFGDVSDSLGFYQISDIAYGDYILIVSIMGYETQQRKISLSPATSPLSWDVELKQSMSSLDQVVVTGSRTSKKIANSPIIVNVIDNAVLESTQSLSLSEGLKFQPGLRVETDCQTCNYTQLRMNGLQGGYSQILINSRPIFSPLTGLYGMEQIPTNMIERIEVVRGGGSALYGSGAVGGTVNVITKEPSEGGYDVSYTHQSIDGAGEDVFSGNATLLNKNKNAGASFYLNKRKREWYDANGDNYSEIPEIDNHSFGTNIFFIPNRDQKIDISFSSLNEYRFGGEMVDGPAHLAQQAEERTHNILVGNVDYRLKFNQGNSTILTYAAFQNTNREHYTGVFPDEPAEGEHHLANPPYGTSKNTTWQAGVQLDHHIREFPLGSNVVTLGSEFVEDDILDIIDAYDYRIDQTTQNLGTFIQSDWEIGNRLNLLSGLRVDHHNLVDQLIASPRFSALYKPFENTQFRATWGSGFRAPQAFDTDLHIAFAGGGVSRVQLSDDLQHERSSSFSGSLNYDKATEHFIYGFTVEGFHTHLRDAFYLQPLGEDEFGEVFEKRNGGGATVKGVTLEFRANYDEKMQFDAGVTFQKSEFDDPVYNSDVLEPRKEFLRTPNNYGYTTMTLTPHQRWSIATNLTYTGSMLLLHLAGAPEQTEDAYKRSDTFTEIGFRASYTIPFPDIQTALELFGGIKNLTNAFQNDFDTGKNRDSNYVYGPALPRTLFFGLKVKSL